jgi:hypothetical protein
MWEHTKHTQTVSNQNQIFSMLKQLAHVGITGLKGLICAGCNCGLIPQPTPAALMLSPLWAPQILMYSMTRTLLARKRGICPLEKWYTEAVERSPMDDRDGGSWSFPPSASRYGPLGPLRPASNSPERFSEGFEQYGKMPRQLVANMVGERNNSREKWRGLIWGLIASVLHVQWRQVFTSHGKFL